jgi:arginine-tRNA-protein transferase
MSLIPTGLNRLLQFYLSGPAPCPYLPDRVEHKLFTRLAGDKTTDSAINATLTRAGFRRSHDIVYRPACHDCAACLPVRVPVRAFAPSRVQRRIAARNADLRLEVASAEATAEQYELFLSYQRARHPDSDMAQMTRADFDHMLQEGEANTSLYHLRATTDGGPGELLGVMLADRITDGLSAVYSFFSPDSPRRSLGVQLILSLISCAAREDLPYVYLGYWIRSARKMAYKGQFKPLQVLGTQGWESED